MTSQGTSNFAPKFYGTFKIMQYREEELKVEFFRISFQSIQILRMRFILRGVGLSHPKISNFEM
jgi:hypothetical protein